VEGHPGFAAGSLGWVVVGAILLVTAVVVLIFSELRVVLVVRDQVAPQPSMLYVYTSWLRVEGLGYLPNPHYVPIALCVYRPFSFPASLSLPLFLSPACSLARSPVIFLMTAVVVLIVSELRVVLVVRDQVSSF